jgi:hypothetical protein
MEIDVGALESDEVHRTGVANGNGNDPPDEYEFRIFDLERERTLVAAIKLVSPANKD